ncbi:hypothetical protein RJ641_034970 [Dillenia turbinata]|uniref:Protein Iojap, chloroplastic n=1 Tax=Dillenia turbinata TaxID=194707 RepID=A0AAN8ZHS5_9MAGN
MEVSSVVAGDVRQLLPLCRCTGVLPTPLPLTVPVKKKLKLNPNPGLGFLSSGSRASSFCSLISRMSLGPNMSEDTDDMYDDLFEKYGKVVFRRNDQKPPSAEVDDDAESLTFFLDDMMTVVVAVAMAKVASEVKAADIRVLFVKPLVYWTRFFIIATAFSRPQIDAIGSKIRDVAEKKHGKIPSGDSKPNSWTLLDFGDSVIVGDARPQAGFVLLASWTVLW